jgi:hypothetical protein
MKNTPINLDNISTQDLVKEMYNRDDLLIIQSYTTEQIQSLINCNKNIDCFMNFMKKGSYLADKISLEIKNEIYDEFLEEYKEFLEEDEIS